MSRREHHSCCAKVYVGWRHVYCNISATRLVDGQWYCHVHDPRAVADREAKRQRKQEAAYEVDYAVARMKDCRNALVKQVLDMSRVEHLAELLPTTVRDLAERYRLAVERHDAAVKAKQEESKR